jgi:hypothetical protein
VFKNRVLQRTFGRKRGKEIPEWTEFFNEDLRDKGETGRNVRRIA